jgi:hypothetical protein
MTIMYDITELSRTTINVFFLRGTSILIYYNTKSVCAMLKNLTVMIYNTVRWRWCVPHTLLLKIFEWKVGRSAERNNLRNLIAEGRRKCAYLFCDEVGRYRVMSSVGWGRLTGGKYSYGVVRWCTRVWRQKDWTV